MSKTNLFFSRPGRVGVTGHRLNRLTAPMVRALADRCEALFASAHKDCRLMSCLADGTDTIAAKAWPDTHGLDVLLPVPVQTWRDVVAPLIPLSELDALIARAHVTCLTDNTEPDYVALAEQLLLRSDRILAVWDGAPGKPGGTGDVVARAQAAGMDVLHIPLESL